MSGEDLLALPARFSEEQYLFWTRIECVAWTAADLVIVICVLQLANRVRVTMGKRPHVFSYAVLGATLLFLPIVVLAADGWSIFFAELAITIQHFLLILYACLADLRLFPAYLADMIARNRAQAEP